MIESPEVVKNGRAMFPDQVVLDVPDSCSRYWWQVYQQQKALEENPETVVSDQPKVDPEAAVSDQPKVEPVGMEEDSSEIAPTELEESQEQVGENALVQHELKPDDVLPASSTSGLHEAVS